MTDRATARRRDLRRSALTLATGQNAAAAARLLRDLHSLAPDAATREAVERCAGGADPHSLLLILAQR